ncbi:MAG: OprD family outer membrane porin [Sulfurospirillaceae bacterium]|nr:OprD family outer membrane porin [Sulfurospirillaceae bacterium]MDD2827198.1 OprD family outer membrane porin [Sulfurospirillaceae bacterium]
MKLAKLSLAAIVVAGLATSTFAADTLADAFKNGKVSGAVQAYYWTKDDGSKDADIFTTGIDLSYQTASFYGFAFKATFQSSSAPFVDKDGKDMFKGDMWGSGAQLSEAYLSYSIGKTTALVGRMYLDTPLVASSGSRMNKQSFEGAAVINTDLPNTTLIAGYVQAYQARTDGKGNFGKFAKEFNTGSGYADGVRVEDGAYTLAAINKSIKGLTLTAAYADVIDIIQVAYAEAAYEGTAGNFTYGLAAQYYYNNADNSIVSENNNLFGVKASLGYNAFGAYVAYSKVNDKAGTLGGVVSGLGGGADLAYTGSPILSDSYANDTEAYKVGVTYAIMKNANIGVNYTNNEIDSANTEYGYTAVEADYSFEGALKGLSGAFIYEDGSKDSDSSAMRLNLNYKF